jgi:hypothetical protein
MRKSCLNQLMISSKTSSDFFSDKIQDSNNENIISFDPILCESKGLFNNFQ